MPHTTSTITLAHGNGGQLMQELIKNTINPILQGDETMTDGAVVTVGKQDIVFSTDSFTVKPIFFPGGDIGTLAVNGTINDLAAMGARPLYLSCAAIIEQGFPISELERILDSISQICQAQGGKIVTGDTKVVERGAADGIYLNTAGIGIREHQLSDRFGAIRPGDSVIISGTVGDHGATIALARDNLGLKQSLQSDCAPLSILVSSVLDEDIEVVFMRDPTRGGLATVLNELIDDKPLGIEIGQSSVPIKPDVQAVCEILGYDPLYLANGGKMVFVTPENHTDKLLSTLTKHPLGQDAALIGTVTDQHVGKVVMKTGIGGSRVLDMLVHDQLPRIC